MPSRNSTHLDCRDRDRKLTSEALTPREHAFPAGRTCLRNLIDPREKGAWCRHFSSDATFLQLEVIKTPPQLEAYRARFRSEVAQLATALTQDITLQCAGIQSSLAASQKSGV